MKIEHKFNYNWTLKDAIFTKDKGKVFSYFACGGGSTMGYKLVSFDVIGCNEIDPKMIETYKANHKPKYAFLEPIQTFKMRKDLPKELYQLDILDGSPPCSSFSISGNREKDWGKDKVFREGQVMQVLDTLFFYFIDLAKKLKPKVVVAENVKGLLIGADMFTVVSKLELTFKEPKIKFSEFANYLGIPITEYAKGTCGSLLFSKPIRLSKQEFCNIGTFPQGYSFTCNFGYLIGMSVPPVTTAQVATNIYDQWLSKL